MQLTYRGSVNRWECDENDHLNVRFCEHKLYQTLLSGLLARGCISSAELPGLPAKIHRQHIRFQSESRIAAPLGGYFGLLEGDDFHVLVELRNEVTGLVACSMLCQFSDVDIAVQIEAAQTKASQGRAAQGIVAADRVSHALPRGIQSDLGLHNVGLEDALALGFRTIGAGVIEPEECSLAGWLMPHHCMGRISDSMPHLWGGVFPESEASEEQGGAVVEFRRTYDGVLAAGDAFQIVSGIVEVGPKVQSFAHLMFDLHTGKCRVNAQAVALRMDLRARKAITMDAPAQAALEAQKIRLPGSR